MNIRKHFFACCAIACLLMAANLSEGYGQTIRYVSTSGNDNNAGNSWGAAFRTVQKGIMVANEGDQVWVAAGTYFTDEGPEDTKGDRDATFEMKQRVAIRGGFPPTGNPGISDRNWKTFVTLLSGEIGTAESTDNAYNVIRNEDNGLNQHAILDGFEIAGGNANGSPFPRNVGGGIVCLNSNPLVINCTIRDIHNGGGCYISGMAPPVPPGFQQVRQIFINCIIRNCYGNGILVNSNEDVYFQDCTFYANYVQTGAGGGGYFWLSKVELVNCVFMGNRGAQAAGSAFYARSSNVSVRHCTISGNQGIPVTLGFGSVVSLYNTILYTANTNTEVYYWDSNNEFKPVYSNIKLPEGSTASGIGNINQDPLFVLPATSVFGSTGNLRLKPESPSVNTGRDADNYLPFDIDGNLRKIGPAVDMGAYETDYLGCNVINPRAYVNASSNNEIKDGKSWATAFSSLQDAINSANQCPATSEIWVAAGTYFPDEGAGVVNNNREAFFSLRNGLAIYGGFAGTETQLSQRNLAGAPSILSGEIQADGDPLNNTNNLFRNTGVNATAILDGFTLKGGAATVAGGAMLNTNASPTIRNCIFESNTAVFNGGAVRNNSSNPTFVNCVFASNTGSGNGGVIFNTESSPSFTNCTFANNTASGGSVFFSQTNAALTLTNCIVWGNTGTVQISNTSTSTNAITYSIVQGGFSGTGNLNANPLFMDGAAGNFQLLSCSPAINTGTATLAPVTDITGTPRPQLGMHDIGAYEYAGKLVLPNNGVLYVNATAAGNNTGNSWANALTNLQDAFNSNCTTISQVWVAAGTYKPTAGNDRNISFALKNGIALYGGFAGTETQLSQRNWFVNQTVLSGDIGSQGLVQDNSYTVVEASNTNATAIIDGFTISNANASEAGAINETVRSMNGGGMYMQNGSPTISNCHFKDNNVRFNGGGIYNISGSPEITNCIFSGNRAEWGGGLYNYVNASPALRNCLFYRNRSFSNGGALLNNNSSNPVGIHCTFAGNIGVNGVAVANYNTSGLNLISSIMWEEANALLQVNAPTPYIIYSLLKGGFAGEGNLDADPLFVNAATDNYQLQACSPAINAGLAWIGSLAYDILGNSRPAFGGFDMGAYERQTALPQILYVDSTATGIGDGSSWANAFNTLEAALITIKNCGLANTIHIAKGTYTPPPPAIAFIMDKLNAIVLGGYPSGGNGARNAAVNPVIIKGNVQVLKSLQIDGVKVEKSDMVNPL